MSASEQGLSLTLRQVLTQLRQLGRSTEATKYEIMVQTRMLIHGLDYEDVLDMTVEEVAQICERRPIPIEFRNHNTFAWGKDHVRLGS